MRFLGILFAIVCMFLPGCTKGIRCIMTEQPAGAGHKRLQDQGNGTCLDVKTGKLWQIAKSKRIKSLEEATLFISEMELAGQSDWRLPTVAELYDLFLFIDANGSGSCRMDFEGNYWSGDADAKGRVGAWELDGVCYPEREYFPKKEGYIRAVRP